MSTARVGSPVAPPRAAPRPVYAAVAAVVTGLERLRSRLLPSPPLVVELAGQLVTVRTLCTVVELGIPDLLAHCPLGAVDLAAATGADQDAVGRMLRLLVARGLVRADRAGRFRLAPAGRALRTDVADSVAPWLRYVAHPDYWRMWGALTDTARSGATAYEVLEASTFFDWLDAHADQGVAFDAAMTATSDLSNAAIVAAADLTGVRSIVDVAGGRGSLLAALLRSNRGLAGVLLERPAVAELARGGPLTDPALWRRGSVEVGDFFDRLPPGHDAYLLKWVLHDWDGPDARKILDVCFTAMRPGARLLVVEMLLDDRDAPVHTLDIAMLALTGGRERSVAEYRRLLAESGFRLRAVTPTASPFHILDAVAE